MARKKNNRSTEDRATSTEPINTPDRYYFEGGLRRVKPYHHTYNTYCKERWRGRTLYDIFTSEFRDRTPEYYVCDRSPRSVVSRW